MIMRGLLLLLWGLAAWSVQAQTVEASLDRDTVFLGETVLLTIEVSGRLQGDAPDVGLLTRDFEILDSRRSQQVEVINDNRRELTRWLFELAPRQIGDLTLPALPIGQGLRTRELALTVLPVPEQEQHANAVFIEVVAEPLDPYVHSQVRYSERIFLATGLRDNALTREAPIEHAVVRPLGDFREYVAQRDGRNYRVYERSFALLPERSGELVLPALTLRGRLPDQRQSLSRGRLIEVRSEPITLQVRPRPPGYSGDHWLPTPTLELSETWPEDVPEFRVGEPITRTLVLSARGLDAAQLPDLDIPALDWARVYPDQPVTETRHDGSWLEGRREQGLALVPTEAGDFTLPGLQLVWWDTEADRERIAELPARRITVSLAPRPDPAPETVAEPIPAAPIPMTGEPGAAFPWPWLSAGLLAVWCLTLLGWWRDRRRRPTAASDTATEPSRKARAARADLRAACRKADAKGAARSLLAWAAAEWPEQPPTSLGALAARASHARESLLALDRALYATDDQYWRGDTLWQAVRGGLRPATPPPAASASALPPLYPERG